MAQSENEDRNPDHDCADERSPQSIVVELVSQEEARAVTAVRSMLGQKALDWISQPTAEPTITATTVDAAILTADISVEVQDGALLSWETRYVAIADKVPSGFEPLYEALQASA